MTTTHSHTAVGSPRAPASDGLIALVGNSPLGARLSEALARAGATIRKCSDADTALTDAVLVIDASSAGSGRACTLHRLEHAIVPTAAIVSILSDETLGALAVQLHDPARLVGLGALALDEPLRFVEIVRGASTSAQVLQKIGDLLEACGIRAITISDAPGGHAERVARAYLNEGLALLGEGIAAQAIEHAAGEAGMSIPPLALLDLLSLEEADRLLHAAAGGHSHDDDGHHGHEHEHAHEHEHGHPRGHEDAHCHQHGHAPRPHGMTTEAVYVLEKMAHGFGRMGRDARRGFYDYEDGEAPELWSGLRVFERRRAAVSQDDLRDRLVFIQAIESLRCLDEGVVACAADANLSAVLGWGFPASRGGAIAFIDSMGVRAFAERARDLATRFGERFDPPSLLLRHAERDEPFGGAAK